MNVRATRHGLALSPEAAADVARITEIWADCRDRFGADGPFLFGRFTIADAMYAPVVSRFRTYGIALDPVAAAYGEAVWNQADMREWIAAAAVEPWSSTRYEI